MKYIINILLIICSINLTFSQELDTINLKNKTRKELQTLFGKYKDAEFRIKIAHQVKELSKENNDEKALLGAYRYLELKSEGELQLQYLDSVILLSKKNPNESLPGNAYFKKGSLLSVKRRFKESLSNYFLANKYAAEYNNLRLKYNINNDIAIIRGIMGDRKEAISILKDNIEILKDIGGDFFNNENAYCLHAIAYEFIKLKEYDSATYYNRKGLLEAQRNKVEPVIPSFYQNIGIVSYFRGDYENSKEKLNKALKYYSEQNYLPNITECNFYLGKVALSEGKQEEAMRYFKKNDSIFEIKYDLLPEFREGYEHLIDFYKKENNSKEQLVYIQKLLKVDSVLTSNYKYIYPKINKEYDTPRLLEKKSNVIKELKGQNSKSFLWIVLLVIIVFFLIYAIVQNRKKQQRYKERFKKLREDKAKVTTPLKEKQQQDITGIKEDIVNHILKELQKFEADKQFLKIGIKADDLAKSFNTNIKYVSKVINVYKKQNLSGYINELRIEYIMERLETEDRLRKYTIKALAREAGFNTGESFSKAFFKKNEIYPSFYLKELNKVK